MNFCEKHMRQDDCIITLSPRRGEGRVELSAGNQGHFVRAPLILNPSPLRREKEDKVRFHQDMWVYRALDQGS